MLDDMALLKRTMQEMDAEDQAVAQAAKDRAAQILGEARLNFAKMAELIEQRRLLLPPAMLARIRKMDQPGMLGDGAFQDTGAALRREGMSFLQIAEAIEASDRPQAAPRHEAPVAESEPLLHAMDDEPAAPAWLRALLFAGRMVLFPVRHPLRSLAIGLFALVLLYGVRGAVVLSEWASRKSHEATAVQHVDAAISSMRSFVHEQISPQARQEQPAPDSKTPSPTTAAASPPSASPPSATPSAAPEAAPPSAAPAPASAPSTPAPPAPSANETAAVAPPLPTPVPSAAGPTVPPDLAPRRDARVASSRAAANRPHRFEDALPDGQRRNSRIAGPCRGGIGGCYWGGVQF
jgi:hypothetical protein